MELLVRFFAFAVCFHLVYDEAMSFCPRCLCSSGPDYRMAVDMIVVVYRMFGAQMGGLRLLVVPVEGESSSKDAGGLPGVFAYSQWRCCEQLATRGTLI